MVRLLLGAISREDTDGHADGGPGTTDERLRGLARRLRDAGHEVVYAGPGSEHRDLAVVLLAAAEQEDLDTVVVPDGDVDALSALLRTAGLRGADALCVVGASELLAMSSVTLRPPDLVVGPSQD